MITVEGKPMWEGECTQCLACLDYRPKLRFSTDTTWEINHDIPIPQIDGIS